jgi:hypothetical protein
MTRWIGALTMIALLGGSGCLLDDDCYGTPTPEPEGSRTELTVPGLDGARYSISDLESCDEDEPIFRFVVTGTGQQPLYQERSPGAAATWFQERVIPRLYEEGLTWDIVWYETHPCNGEQPGIAVSTWAWAHANEVAKVIAQELADDDRAGGIAVLLNNYVYCPA